MKNIMIKTAIASAVVAATTVTTIADATVYGRLRTALVCTDSGNNVAAPTKDNDCGLENYSSRFGIKASSQINDGLTAFGRYEFATTGDTAGGVNGGRLAYVGLKGGFGEVSLGHRWSPIYTHTVSPIDAPNAFGGTSQTGYGGAFGGAGGIGYNSPFRVGDTLNYKNKFGAASVHLQLVANDNDNPGTTNSGDFIDALAVGASFKAGPATIGVGYMDTTDVGSLAAIHARGKFGPVGIGGTYSTVDIDGGTAGDVDSLMLALNYGMGGGKTINLTYGQDDPSVGNATPTSIGLEYAHNMGAGFKWFAGYEVSDLDVTGQDSISRLGAGMRYDF